jgi:hypothetical protein
VYITQIFTLKNLNPLQVLPTGIHCRDMCNSISAKESRKRKMTYVEGLEKRVKMCTSENAQLKKKVDGLEQQNQYVDLVS